MNVEISRILIRIGGQGSHYCPMCRHGAKHVASLECLDRFWRPIIPRKLDAVYISRLPVYYHGTDYFAIYRNEELGYAVGAVHFGFAMITLTKETRLFWKHVVDFIEEDMKVRPDVPFVRKFGLVLHVLESLAWRSQDGELFPTPLIVWYTVDAFLIKHKELHKLIARLEVREYAGISS